ncbi:glycerophosphodiester phosphodiesterase family protein [Pseudopedobacter beijingensis]|uniref:Glycerophosphodiester phosphodiesterase family protein n=1 Tax=Pseudopedobacter beijingensis TaxID=1207056 RepID=A0ABW4ICB7_9SPHI
MKILKLIFLLIISSEVYAQVELHTLRIENQNDLKEFFRYAPDRIPLVCAHRGGVKPGFPENSIATFEYTLSQIPAFFEVDPRLTKDGVIVAFHDATLDKKTDGIGNLADHTWEEVQQLRLKDNNGNITPYKIHKLEEILQWAKGKTILILDKKDVPFDKLLTLIEANRAESYVLISAYKLKEALYYHKRNPKLMFEAMIKDENVMEAYQKSGIPWQNIVAFTGQPLKPELNAKLRAKGVMCMVSTMKFEEKLGSRGARAAGYKKLVENGIDVVLTDRAIEVSAVLKNNISEESSKSKFFQQATFNSGYTNVKEVKRKLIPK